MAELVGQIPLFANDIEVGNVTSVSVTPQKPQKIVKYMNGRAERVSGVADFAWNITTSTRAQRQEILDIIGGPLAEGFSLTFVIGGQRFKLLDCGLSSTAFSSSTDDAPIALAGVSPELIEV